ncbi:DHA2 family efflux MFS transporter permease subunit [Streptomyces flavofungini]|uniref:DHA2 family efflux MFS transporter permease subunit n=1 Tax=Streptomyces flavofungini TaxID=68200 RepID=UPI0025B004ED|nr:DHA2 family efflux MFS transporter permease subunit [Streptomyces flavofungini]WJV51026.1 DHA2 family efflux MFS transporter permease subunit [Streptomyces flavofungini]
MPPASPRRPWLILAVLCVGFFAITMDTTMVNAAVPVMISEFDAGLAEALWVVNAHVLTYAALLITAGRLGDRFGPKRLYLVGLTVFTLAAAGCATSDSIHELTALRVVQGLGAALLTPQTSAFITVLFPPRRRGAAFGVWGGVIGLSAVAGPLAGGALIALAGWEWIFLAHLPVGAVAFVLAAVFVPDHRPRVPHRWDVTGTLLVTSGLGAFCYGLLECGRPGGAVSAASGAWVGVGVALLVCLVAQQRRARGEPLVPRALYRAPAFAGASAIGAGVHFAVLGTVLPLLLYLQSVLGHEPLAAATITAPSALAVGVVAVVVGRWSVGARTGRLLTFGLLLYAAGLALTVLWARPGMNAWQLLPPMLIADAGIGCTLAPVTALALHHVAPALASGASGVLNTARQLGGVLGGVAVGSFLRLRLAAELPAHAHDAAKDLPARLRAPFTDSLLSRAGDGLARPPAPAGLSPYETARFTDFADAAFQHTFLSAWRTTMTLPIGVLLLCCLLSRRLSRSPVRRAP